MTNLSLTATVEPVKPTKIFRTHCGKIKVCLFGTPNDFGPQGNSAIITETLKFYAGVNGVKNIFAPSCKKFNAEIICAENLRHKIRLRGGLVFHRGCFADGVILTAKGDSFFVSSADCPTIIAIGEKIVIATHAGRNCLIDNGKIHTGKQSRKHRSVVDAMIENFLMTGEKISNIRVFITCGIKSENFPHSINHRQYGEKNKVFIEYLTANYGKCCFRGDIEDGMISLKDLIKIQFSMHGVPSDNLYSDNIDTHSDKNYSGNHLWHSCARGKTSEEKKRRNGVFVIKNF